MPVTYPHVLSFSVSLLLSHGCVTTDALMMREKVGISFARLIPEVSSIERERSKESTRPKESEGGQKDIQSSGCHRCRCLGKCNVADNVLRTFACYLGS